MNLLRKGGENLLAHEIGHYFHLDHTFMPNPLDVCENLVEEFQADDSIYRWGS